MSSAESSPPGRVALAQLPTPLEFADRLSASWGHRIWIKRDDLTGFGLSGNKVRKLELHLAAAQQQGATTLVTCGAVQSNHCRATAIAAARLGMDCVLLLRSPDGNPPPRQTGNHLLQRLAGAEVRFITPDQFRHHRQELMDSVADELAASGTKAWTMPAGASDHLGMMAFELATTELVTQATDAGVDLALPVHVWHASSSGGTTAGLAMGAHQASADLRIIGASVGETVAEMHEAVQQIFAEAEVPDPAAISYEVTDDWIGLGYGLTTDEELAVQVEGSRLTGLIWDPTYTGKALYALHEEIRRGRFSPEDQIVFWHTGGGFAAFAHDFGGVL